MAPETRLAVVTSAAEAERRISNASAVLNEIKKLKQETEKLQAPRKNSPDFNEFHQLLNELLIKSWSMYNVYPILIKKKIRMISMDVIH